MKTIIPLFLLVLQASLWFTAPFVAAPSDIALTTAPDCVSWGPDRIDCVAGSTDDAIWHISYMAGVWSQWEPLTYHAPPGGYVGGPSVSSWSVNRLDVFVEGAADRALWHTYWTGSSWSGWESLGGSITSDPDCVSREVNLIDCFARGDDNAVWSIYFDGSAWGAWFTLGGTATSGPAVASTSANNLDMFVRNTDNGLSHRAWTGSGGWGAWEFVPDTSPYTYTMTSDPDCVSSVALGVDGPVIYCVANTANGRVVYKVMEPKDYLASDLASGYASPFYPLGDFATDYGPAISSRSLRNTYIHTSYGLDIFAEGGPGVAGGDRALWHIFNDPTSTLLWGAWEKVVPSTPTIFTIATTPGTVTTSTSTANTVTFTNTIITATSAGSTQSLIQSTTSTTTQSSATNLPVTVVQTQTVTQPPTSTQTAPPPTQPGILDMLQQNGLPVIAALGVLILLLAVVTLKRRGGKPGSPPPATTRIHFL